MGTKAAVIHSQKRIWADEEAVAATAYKGCEGSIDLVAIARVQRPEFAARLRQQPR